MFKITNALSGLLVCFMFSSCATLFNGRIQTVRVHTTEASKIIVNSDTINTSENRAELSLPRARTPVEVVALSEYGIKKVQLKSRTSSNYYFNGFGIFIPGLIVDLFSPKRFAYPDNIYLNSNDPSNEYKTYSVPKDGDVFFHSSFPTVGAFKLKPDQESWKRSVGVRLGLGFEYYHTDRQYLNISGNAVIEVKTPNQRATRPDAEEEKSSTYYLSISNNHKINRLSLGYGLAYAVNIWEFLDDDPFEGPLSMMRPTRKKYDALGILFSSYYQTGQVVNFGVSYRPTFFRFNAARNVQYEHLLTFDMVFKLKIGEHP